MADLAEAARNVACSGALPIAAAVKDKGLHGVLLPPDNAPEAGVIDGVNITPVQTLAEVSADPQAEQR